MAKLKPLIVILGPTASGKTRLALRLAKEFDGELINADSRQIYRGMDIATNKFPMDAKIGKRDGTSYSIYEFDGVPEHLLDLVDPDDSFTMAEYKEQALSAIGDIHGRGRLPILVGGTGLYISAIVDNLDIPRAPADDKLREELSAHTSEELFAALDRIDPEAAESIGPHNKRKLIRALEVFKLTGGTFSSQQKRGPSLFDVLQIGIRSDRKELYAKIDARVDEMMVAGLIEETERLMQHYDPNLPSMSGIGYREVGAYLRGEITLDDAVQRIKYHTHQYARRQMTWFKRDGRIRWADGHDEIRKIVAEFLVR